MSFFRNAMTALVLLCGALVPARAESGMTSGCVTGHYTAIDALAAGLPLVAMASHGFAVRVSASVLAAAGVPEFAVATMAEYHALALMLATDAGARAHYRSRLAGVQDTKLFDATGLCRALESAYARMAQIARSGGAPEAFTVTG